MEHIYTIEDVEKQLKNACLVYYSLPKECQKEVHSCLGQLLKTEIITTETPFCFHPTPQEIDDADTVQFKWLPLLDLIERRLVWKRYSGMGWKRLATEFGISERTARRYSAKAVEKIWEKVTKH